MQGQAEQDGQFGRARAAPLSREAIKISSAAATAKAGKMRVAVQKQAILVEIAVGRRRSRPAIAHQNHRRADDRPELLVDCRPAGTTTLGKMFFPA